MAVIVAYMAAAPPSGVTSGEWLIGGATSALALATAGLALVAYFQLTGLRREANRQRAYTIQERYHSASFVPARQASTAVLKRRRELGGMAAAVDQLTELEQLEFDRYVNFMEEVSQQYLAGLVDRDIAEEGPAYVAFCYWKVFEEYAAAKRHDEKSHQVLENWEVVYEELRPLYDLDPKIVEELARAWMKLLGRTSKARLARRLKCFAPPNRRLRIASDWRPRPWDEAIDAIRAAPTDLGRFCAQADELKLEVEGAFVIAHARPLTQPVQPTVGAVALSVSAVRRRRGPRRRWQVWATRSPIAYAVSGFGWYASAEEARADMWMVEAQALPVEGS